MSPVVLYPLKVLLPYNCDITAVVNVPIHILRAKKHFFSLSSNDTARVHIIWACPELCPEFVLSPSLIIPRGECVMGHVLIDREVLGKRCTRTRQVLSYAPGKIWGTQRKKVAVLDANLGEFLNGLLCWLKPPIHQINSIRCGISHVFCHKAAKTRQIGRCGRNSHHSTLRYTKPITTSTIANPCRK